VNNTESLAVNNTESITDTNTEHYTESITESKLNVSKIVPVCIRDLMANE